MTRSSVLRPRGTPAYWAELVVVLFPGQFTPGSLLSLIRALLDEEITTLDQLSVAFEASPLLCVGENGELALKEQDPEDIVRSMHHAVKEDTAALLHHFSSQHRKPWLFFVAGQALGGLVCLDPNFYLDVLHQLASSPRSSKKQAAAEACATLAGEIGSEFNELDAVLEILRELLRDRNENVRKRSRKAMREMGRLHPTEATKALLTWVKANDQFLSLSIAALIDEAWVDSSTFTAVCDGLRGVDHENVLDLCTNAAKKRGFREARLNDVNRRVEELWSIDDESEFRVKLEILRSEVPNELFGNALRAEVFEPIVTSGSFDDYNAAIRRLSDAGLNRTNLLGASSDVVLRAWQQDRDKTVRMLADGLVKDQAKTFFNFTLRNKGQEYGELLADVVDVLVADGRTSVIGSLMTMIDGLALGRISTTSRYQSRLQNSLGKALTEMYMSNSALVDRYIRKWLRAENDFAVRLVVTIVLEAKKQGQKKGVELLREEICSFTRRQRKRVLYAASGAAQKNEQYLGTVVELGYQLLHDEDGRIWADAAEWLQNSEPYYQQEGFSSVQLLEDLWSEEFGEVSAAFKEVFSAGDRVWLICSHVAGEAGAARVFELLAPIDSTSLNEPLKAMLRSFVSGLREADVELVRYYEVRDTLRDVFGKEAKAQKAVDVSKARWQRLGKLSNVLPLRQGRHRGRDWETCRDASPQELEEGRGISARMIQGYIEYIHAASLPPACERGSKDS